MALAVIYGTHCDLTPFAARLRKRRTNNVTFQICAAHLATYAVSMVRTKNPTQSVELRLSVNLSLDDVGLTRLYQELREIEVNASGLASIKVHALKRRHLLKILHAYCADASEHAQRNTEAIFAQSNQKLSTTEKLAQLPATA